LVYVGNVAADATGALLVLDTKNTSGDPTAPQDNGAIYYNTGGQGGATAAVTGYAGKLRCYEGGAWKNCIGMRDIVERRWGLISTANISSIALNYGGSLMSGMLSSGAATTSAQAEGLYVNYATTGASLSTNGWGGDVSYPVTATQLRWLPKFSTRVRVDPSAVTNYRDWVAVAEATTLTFAPPTTSASSSNDYIGMGSDTTVASGAWICSSGDGTNHSGVSTGVTLTAGHYYDIIVDMSNPAILVCSVSDNGGPFVSVSKTTNLPSSSSAAMGITNGVAALAAVVRNHSINYFYLETQ
jgi:hypothetical protein